VDKSLILKQLIDKVNHELLTAEEAMNSTMSLNSADDMKQEGKYDTRAIESGYLAGAQQARVDELKLELQMLEEINPSAFMPTDAIAIGALVELELNQKIQKYFLCSTAGGTLLNVEGESILVISVFSPIGNAMLDLSVDDSFELETPKGSREYHVKSVR
jgi:transcription elongation GreA/GreB family factor